jgi:hypothetical protein
MDRWEESLPLRGPAHEQAAELLRSLGIVDKARDANADNTVKTLSDKLIEPFKWLVYSPGTVLPHTGSGSFILPSAGTRYME